MITDIASRSLQSTGHMPNAKKLVTNTNRIASALAQVGRQAVVFSPTRGAFDTLG